MSALLPGSDGVLVITNWRDLEHPEAGGAEVVCQQLARRFAAQGQRVVLLTAAVAGRRAVEEVDGYTIVRAGDRFSVYPRALLWLVRHRREVTAVIDSQNGIPFFTPLAVPTRTPVVMLLHHVHQDQFAAYFPAPAAALGRWLESTASRVVYGRRGIVTVSPSTRTGARRRLRLRGDIWVAPPGWSVTPDPSHTRTEHPSVVCVGRLVPHKRTEMVVQAFAAVRHRHPRARLVVVGRGPEAERLHAVARDAGVADAVTFRDDLDDAGRDRTLASAWVSVNASAGEGWGLSVVEANALGVPVLAYRRPGLRDSVVPGQTGWLIDDDDDLGGAVADALDEVSDPVRAAALSAQARAWADRFTWEAMTDRVRGALQSEEARLHLGGADQRVSSDLATLVTMPLALLDPTWPTRVRDTDVIERTDDSVTVLCRGADTQSVRHLLSRLGVDEHDALPEGFSVSVARTSDLLRVQRATEHSSGITRG